MKRSEIVELGIRMSKTVLIFRYELLPISETFIQSQAGALTDFQPCYAGVEPAAKSLAIPHDSVLLMNGKSFVGRVERRAFLTAGWAPRFFRRLRDKAPALIHAHFAPDGAIALPLASELRTPLIVTLHGYDVTVSAEFLRRGHGRVYMKRKQRLLDQASLFICVSEFIKQKALEAGFPNSKLRVHHIGVDRAVFTARSEMDRQDVVLFVGRLVEKKGCKYLIQAMDIVQKKRKDISLVIIGDGPQRQSLESLATAKGVACQFLGTQPTHVIREWLGRARVLCLPSVTAKDGASEGLPIVLTEAQAMAVPVVSSIHAGIPEVVRDGETGLLAPERDFDALAGHIFRYLSDKTFWRRCSEAAPKWIQHRFDLHKQTRELEDIYARVMGSSS